MDQIRERLAAFQTRYNAIAKPFSWKFTRTDLDDLLHRITAHNNAQPHTLAAAGHPEVHQVVEEARDAQVRDS